MSNQPNHKLNKHTKKATDTTVKYVGTLASIAVTALIESLINKKQ